MNVNTAQTAFSGGELSPLVLGRHDIEKFGVGGEIVENFMPLSQGPLVRRPGSSYINESGFIFRTLCFHYSSEVFYIIKMHMGTQNLAVINQDGVQVAEVVHPYREEDLFDISYTQSADIMFFAHSKYPPGRLMRYAENDWVFDFAPIVNGPFQNITHESDIGVALSTSSIVDETVLSVIANGVENPLAGLSVSDHIAFNKNGRELLGVVTAINGNETITIKSLEDMCFYMPKEVFTTGIYDSWDSSKGLPVLKPFFLESITNYPAFGSPLSTTSTYMEYRWNCHIIDSGQAGYWVEIPVRQPIRETRRNPTIQDVRKTVPHAIYMTQFKFIGSSTIIVDDTGQTPVPFLEDAVYKVAFSNTHAVTRPMVHNYLNFCNERGQFFWAAVAGVDNIMEQGAYGIIAIARFIKVYRPPTGVVLLTGDRKVTATITAASDVFDAARDTGRPLALLFDDIVIYAKLLEITPRRCNATLSRVPPPSNEETVGESIVSTTDWMFGAWYVGNYPACVCFFEQRLVFAATPIESQSIWMSRTADLYNFAPMEEDGKVLDDSAISLTLASTSMNRIKWLQPKQTLIVGTLGSEWIVQAGSTATALTPTNATARNHSSYGSVLNLSHGLSRSTIYVQRGSEKLRDMSYDYYNDIYVSLDLTVFSEHILRDGGGAVYHDYLGSPNPMIFVLLADGTIAVLCYEPDQKVYSWARWKFPYPVRSIACVDSGGKTGIFLCCEQRKYEGGFVHGIYSLEYLDLSEKARTSSSTHFDRKVKVPIGGNLFWDADRKRWTVWTAEWFTWAPAKEAVVSVDGVPVLDVTVESATGQYDRILLPERFTETTNMTNVVVGRGYTAIYKSFPMSVQLQSGNTQGKRKRVTSVGVRFKDTVYGKIGKYLPKWPHGTGSASVEIEDLSKRPDIQFTPGQPSSFDYATPIPNGFDTRGQFVIIQDKPCPMTIMAVYPETSLTTE